MIINGKDINVNYRAAQTIQQKIDVAPEIPETAKVELSKKEIKELSQTIDQSGGFSDAINYGGMFGTESNIINGVNTADTRIGYYDTYDRMDACPYVHRGLEVIADDSCQKNIEGYTVKIYSNDEDIKQILEKLFHEKLNLNKELWSIVFETCKFGDNFYEIIPDDYEHPKEIVRIRYLDPRKTNRIEKNGKLAFYTYRTELDNSDFNINSVNSREKEKQEVIYKLQPWQVVHFKITDKKFAPYGGSLLAPGIESFTRFSLLQESMLVYRLVRVPERRVFKIDIGNLSNAEGMRAIQKIKDANRAKQIVDKNGRIQKDAMSLSMLDDIYIPTREGQAGTEVTTLQPGVGLNNIDDIKLFRDEILWILNIPPEHLGYTSDGQSSGQQKGSLAMQDVKFARFLERIQYYIEEGLTKIAAVELFFQKKKKADLKNFRIELTPPSHVKEIMDIEYLNQKIGLISAMLGTNLFPKDFILKYVMKMSKKEIADINLQKDIEMSSLAAQQGGMGGDMMGGMGGMPMTAPMPDASMGGDMNAMSTPAMSIKTEELTPGTMVKLFGKEVLIENKGDYSKLMKALDEYNKQKEQDLIKEEVEEKISNNEFLEKVRGLLVEEQIEKTNKMASALYYENELAGLDFKDGEFVIYEKVESKSKSKSKKRNSLLTEQKEITKKLI